MSELSRETLYFPRGETGLITQDELRLHVELQHLIREERNRWKSIREKVRCQCSVENGDLAVLANVVQLRSFSFAKLVPIIGREEAEQLRNQIAPTEQLFIRVVDLTTGKTAKGSGHITLESLQQLP